MASVRGAVWVGLMAVAKALPQEDRNRPSAFRALDLATLSRQLGWAHFLLVLGACFSFIARQKRMPVGGEGYFLDLLFFPRGRKRLITIELKVGDFKPADKGQMELYLRWLDKHGRQPGQDKPLGLVTTGVRVGWAYGRLG